MAEGTLAGSAYQNLAREYAGLEDVVDLARRYEKALKEKVDLEGLTNDPDLGAAAAEELYELKGRLTSMEQEVKNALVPKEESDTRNAILEIRAGTGGDEAALFAADLFGMYRGYASLRGWTFEVIDGAESDLGGYKEIVCEITGRNVYERLKFESGVHRVQRVPKTEASGRVHTSAATVAVLPEAEEADVQINDSDLRVDTYRSQGAGGQHVNKTESAIRITHLPTGIVVAVQDERSQHKNRARAMTILRSKIYEEQQSKLDATRAADRKAQVGSGDRSERIRTYNFPQGRVTDHRINLTLYNLPDVMKGDGLEEVITALLREENMRKLAALDL